MTRDGGRSEYVKLCFASIYSHTYKWVNIIKIYCIIGIGTSGIYIYETMLYILTEIHIGWAYM